MLSYLRRPSVIRVWKESKAGNWSHNFGHGGEPMPLLRTEPSSWTCTYKCKWSLETLAACFNSVSQLFHSSVLYGSISNCRPDVVAPSFWLVAGAAEGSCLPNPLFGLQRTRCPSIQVLYDAQKNAACWLDWLAQVSSQKQQGGAGDLSSAFNVANFSLWSSCESLRGMTLMPRSLRASWYGAAAFNARATCPRLPLTSTGRAEPLSVSSVTTLSLPTFT